MFSKTDPIFSVSLNRNRANYLAKKIKLYFPFIFKEKDRWKEAKNLINKITNNPKLILYKEETTYDRLTGSTFSQTTVSCATEDGNPNGQYLHSIKLPGVGVLGSDAIGNTWCGQKEATEYVYQGLENSDWDVLEIGKDIKVNKP